MRRSGTYRIFTPEEGLAYCREQRHLGRHVVMTPLIAGIDPSFSWESLELMASRIIPELARDAADALNPL
ncbi:hypothetical protein WG907_11425 [Sphingobium sp. AN558]|uniref:hypothetical protein n=1 Tax=Sphingobium sp. AN558 TaxID=3133442 RepID=UPI0030BF2EAF